MAARNGAIYRRSQSQSRPYSTDCLLHAGSGRGRKRVRRDWRAGLHPLRIGSSDESTSRSRRFDANTALVSLAVTIFNTQQITLAGEMSRVSLRFDLTATITVNHSGNLGTAPPRHSTGRSAFFSNGGFTCAGLF